MSIQAVEEQIEAIVNTVVEVKTVYKYPVEKLAGEFPILTILYTGFNARHATGRSQDTNWQWDFAVYLPVRNARESWETLKDLVPAILEAFRQKQTLNDTVWDSIIESGEPFWDVNLGSRGHYGHSFRLTARREEG
ncbi:MAG: hypothetical protein AB7E55_01225 [Pigmentiphaga sp.]